MDFTEIYKQSSSLVLFSPGTHFILTAVQDRLIVRRTDTFQIMRTWLLDLAPSPTHTIISSKLKPVPYGSSSEVGISHVGWSCDSEYILAACTKRGAVHLLKLRDEEWTGRIDAGAEGLTKAEWAPDGRHILCFSEWGLRVTVWSLLTGTSIYIQFPVHPDRGYAFRADGRYFILAERHKSKDTLGLYDTEDQYKLVRHFPLPTGSLSSLAISPTGNYIAIWEGPLEYKLHVVSLAGDIQTSFTPEPDPGFGIRSVAWHPNGLFLAVGGWDDKIHILSVGSWSEVATLELSSKIPTTITVWREPSDWLESTGGRGFLSYEKLQGAQVLNVNRADQTKPAPKCGAVQIEWNISGNHLLVRFDNVPNAVHIFDFPISDQAFVPHLRTILLHSHPVLNSRWNPARKGNLVVCCGTRGFYMWSDEWVGENGKEEEIAECIGVPAKRFETKDVRWAPDGKGLILVEKDQFCCAFEVQEEATVDAVPVGG